MELNPLYFAVRVGLCELFHKHRPMAFIDHTHGKACEKCRLVWV